MGETAGGAKAGAEALKHHVRPADKNQINCAPFECRTMDPPRFREAFYVMSAICVFFYGILVWIGIDFLFGNSERWVIFVMVLMAGIVYVLAVGLLWARSTHAMSISAASGISSGGLMVQLFILFPVWAPVVVWLARKGIVNS